MAQKTILLQCVWCWASKMPRLTGHWTRAITPLNFFLPGTSYGRGVYFARDASFSVKYARGAVIALGLATFTFPSTGREILSRQLWDDHTSTKDTFQTRDSFRLCGWWPRRPSHFRCFLRYPVLSRISYIFLISLYKTSKSVCYT